MTRYGYARVSTVDQDTGLQVSALMLARCDCIVQEKRSAIKKRPELDKLLSAICPGDELVIYRLDRLARSLSHLMEIVDHVSRSGARLVSLSEPIDHTSAAGRMFLQVLGSVAEFERSLIRERCMAGQLEAVKNGRSIGRRSRLTAQEQSEVVQLYSETGIPVADIGRAYGVSGTRVRSLYLEAIGAMPRAFGKVRQLHMQQVGQRLNNARRDYGGDKNQDAA